MDLYFVAMKQFFFLSFASITLFCISCARQNTALTDQDLFVNQTLTNIINAGNPNALDKIVFTRSLGDGSFLTRFNATNLDFYIYFHFASNEQVPLSEKDGTGWDIAFNRYKGASNSGATNPFASGGVCQANSTNFELVASRSPSLSGCGAANFTLDQSTTTQGIGGAGAVFVGNPVLTEWYNYTIGNLTTKGEVYIIRSGTGTLFYAVRVENYYSDAGTSGYPTIRWKQLP